MGGAQGLILRIGGLILMAFGAVLASLGGALVRLIQGLPLPASQLIDPLAPLLRALTAGSARPAPDALIEGLMQSKAGYYAVALVVMGALFAVAGLLQVITGRRHKFTLLVVMTFLVGFVVAATSA